jgi:hypothetical protein
MPDQNSTTAADSITSATTAVSPAPANPAPAAAETKPAETATASETADAGNETSGAAADPNTVMVKAIKSFHGIEGFKNPQSEPFAVSKQRAAEMFAADIVEYVNNADEDADIDAQADAGAKAAKAAAEGRRTRK